MSVLSPKRVFFAILATAVLAANAFAANPSPRAHARMVWDPDAGELVLFGGSSEYDRGTQRAYDSNETWVWNGARWAQRFPERAPSPRAGTFMAFDSTRGRIVVFGGRQATGQPEGQVRVLDDTWVYDNNNWTELAPPNAPDARQLGAMAYDPLRDRMVLYGGAVVGADGLIVTDKFDTWEFDGTTWTKVGDEAVKVTRPIMAWDKARNQMILVGSISETTNNVTVPKPHMYRFDTASKTWIEIKPAKMPDCASDASMVYQDHDNTLLLFGGLCAVADGTVAKAWQWNGTTWADVATSSAGRVTGAAMGYDPLRQVVVMFGGFDAFESSPRSITMLFRDRNWKIATLTTRPSPRSLYSFTTDPTTQTVWLFGGVSEHNDVYLNDVWGYRGGQFFSKTFKGAPATCEAPMAAFDSNRNRTVFVCWTLTSTDFDVYEFDGVEFKSTNPRNKPEARRFGTLVYDENLKKVVLFGGFDLADYKDDTWTWDGTNWTEVKRDKPPNRALHAMWYDPIQKRTILYGGIGRESIEHRVDRFSDMWAFDGQRWTKLNVANTPGERLGAQYAVDPNSGKLLLFGGMKAELTDPENENSRRQFFANDTWQWDGGSSTWTKLEPARSPAPRQNARLAYDPHSKRLILFGGFAGLFYSDIWSWTGTNWEVHADLPGGRRRAAGGGGTPQAPSTSVD